MDSQKDIKDMMNEQKVLTNNYNRLFKVEISKGLMTLINIFGWTNVIGGYALAWLNVDTFTRTIMQYLGCLFLLLKIAQGAVSLWHKIEMNKIERRQKRFEQQMREEEYLRKLRLK